jgi:hypothetical protein
MPNTEWHWEQGTKYAVEALKALLVINGGAAVALLAFAGQISKNGGDLVSTASRLGNSLLGFGLGALFAAMAFVAAYIAQLQYGRGGENYCWAHLSHFAAYLWLIFSVAAFVTGLVFARAAILAGV